MARPLALSVYLAFARRAVPFAERRLARRLGEGKEDPARLDERRGLAGRPRPDGPLVWMHAASVGESLSLLDLIRQLGAARPDLSVLVTTGTVTSAGLMAARLPDRAVHQYVPLDAHAFVTRFLDHWRPDLAIWTESELWPALLTQTAGRGIPMLLINARMSQASAERWRFLRSSAAHLLGLFRTAHAQDPVSAAHLHALGLDWGRMEVTGTLKEGAAALPVDEAARSDFARALAGRPSWLAAATHEGEEAAVIDAHRAALRTNHRLLLFLVPRHPDRGAAMAARLQAEGWSVALRSRGDPLVDTTQIYLADTMGELGLWYRLAPVSFVGGSLVPMGGHNPFEPAALGSAILHGPYVQNFQDIYQRLAEADATRMVTSATGLAAGLDSLLQPETAAAMAHSAWAISSAGAEATDKARDLILDCLDGLPDGAIPGPQAPCGPPV